MISAAGELVVNPRMYAQFVTFSLQFFDLVCGAAAPGSRQDWARCPLTLRVNTDNKAAVDRSLGAGYDNSMQADAKEKP